MAYVGAYDWGKPDYLGHKRLGIAHVYLGNDSAYLSTVNTQVTADILSSGWHKSTSDIQGRYISIRREGLPVADVGYIDGYNISKFEAF